MARTLPGWSAARHQGNLPVPPGQPHRVTCEQGPCVGRSPRGVNTEIQPLLHVPEEHPSTRVPKPKQNRRVQRPRETCRMDSELSFVNPLALLLVTMATVRCYRHTGPHPGGRGHMDSNKPRTLMFSPKDVLKFLRT